MNKKILIPLIVIGVIGLAIAISWIFWLTKESKPLQIFILDKTVPTAERIEHKSFNWILNHNKYVKNTGERYDVNTDYYGFFPLNVKTQEFDFRSIRIHDIKSIADEYDMLYYTDTYGVYYNEWYKQGTSDVKHTQKVYGGLNQNDYLLLKEMKERKKLIITEFNLYNAPTNGLIREKVEELFDLKWSGWTGKYFQSLDTAENYIPQWISRLYLVQNNNQWHFKNSGIVLVHKFGTIAVLELGTHLIDEIPFIQAKQEMIDRFGVPEETYYSQWFDITFSGEQNNVLANFNINVNAQGDSILRSYNLKPVFPAVIEHTGDYSFYYFGGDFAENEVNMSVAYLEGFHNVLAKLNRTNYSNTHKFYWNFYVPVITTILDDYYQRKE